MEALGWVCAVIGLAGFGAVSVMLWRIDVRSHRLPNRWLVVAALWLLVWLGTASVLLGEQQRLTVALLAACGYLLVVAALWLKQPHSFGAGDVKLMPICAFAVGWTGPVAALFVFPAALVLSTIPGIIGGLRRPEKEFPFGPSLIAACWLTLAIAGGSALFAWRIG